MAKKRKKNDLMNHDHNLTKHVTTGQSSKRMKGNPKEVETHPPASDRGSTCSSNDDHADSDATETSDWNVDSSDGYSSRE